MRNTLPILENSGDRNSETLLSDTPDREPVVAIVVIGGVDIRGIDVQVVPIRGIVHSSRPPVAVATLIVRRARVEVAGEGQIDHPELGKNGTKLLT